MERSIPLSIIFTPCIISYVCSTCFYPPVLIPPVPAQGTWNEVLKIPRSGRVMQYGLSISLLARSQLNTCFPVKLMHGGFSACNRSQLLKLYCCSPWPTASNREMVADGGNTCRSIRGDPGLHFSPSTLCLSCKLCYFDDLGRMTLTGRQLTIQSIKN